MRRLARKLELGMFVRYQLVLKKGSGLVRTGGRSAEVLVDCVLVVDWLGRLGPGMGEESCLV